MRSNFVDYITLLRPVNVGIGAIAILVGAVIAGTGESADIFFACVSGALVMAGGNVVNDYFDVDIDRINKPNRPLPSEKLTQTAALLWASALFFSGIFLSIFINSSAVVITVLISFGLLVYSAILKRTLLLGNIAVSFFSGMAFVYGGVAVEHLQPTLFPAGFAFLFHLGREIIKDIEDQDADAALNAKTLPVELGTYKALQIASVILVGLIFVTLIPFIVGIYGQIYFWVVILGVDFVIVVSLILLWRNPVPKQFRRISMVFKIDMLIGLLAIYLGTRGV